MRYFFVLFASLLLHQTSFAKKISSCGTRTSTKAEIKEARILIDKWEDHVSKERIVSQKIVVPTSWHRVKNGDEGNSDEDIEKSMKVLNSAFAPNFIFKLNNIITSTVSDFWGIGAANSQNMRIHLHQGNCNTLNIYSSKFSQAGYATFPRYCATDGVLDGVIIDYKTVPDGRDKKYNRGYTLVHEVGHWLGLFHIFENGCSGYGDGIDDTPPMILTAKCKRRDSCKDNLGEDLVNNFMGYTADKCRESFTEGQVAAMRSNWYTFRHIRSTSRIAASEYSDQRGIEIINGIIGNVDNGDYITYSSLDFGEPGSIKGVLINHSKGAYDGISTEGWTRVRHVPKGYNWHAATDQLRGTQVYGSRNNDNHNWSINFDHAVPKYDEFLFATGDKQKWLIANKTEVMGFYANEFRNIIDSSQPKVKQARWYRRHGNTEDPWISITDHGPAIFRGDIVYGENNYGHTHASATLPIHNGADVYIRRVNKINKINKIEQRGIIEMRLGDSSGTVIAQFNPAKTGGWSYYQTAYVGIENVTGVHDVTFVAKGGDGIFNVAWFELSNFSERRVHPRIAASEYSDQTGIEMVDGIIGNVDDGDYMTYSSVDFGEPGSTKGVLINHSKGSHGGTIEIRLGDSSGTVIAQFNPAKTGSWSYYQTAYVGIEDVTGVHDVTFVAKGGDRVFDVAWFELSDFSERRVHARIAASEYSDQTGIEMVDGIIGNVDNGDYITYSSLDFGEHGAANSTKGLLINYSKGSHGGTIEMRLGDSSGTVIVQFNPSITSYYQMAYIGIEDVTGVHDVTFVAKGGENIFNLAWFELSNLHYVILPSL